MRPLLALLAVCAATFHADAQITTKGYDTPSYIEFATPRFEVSETETNAVVTVVRTGDYRRTASVDYSTQDGTAEGNVNFKPCGGTLVFAAGESFKTINIPVLREQPEPVKTFQVALAQPATSQVVVITPTAEVEIKSTPPSLAIKLESSGIQISWADIGVPFRLESQIDGSWVQVGDSPELIEGEWKVQIAVGARVELFRLVASN